MRGRNKILRVVPKHLFHSQSGTGVPHSTTLRVCRAQPRRRQVLECGRASAAFPPATKPVSRNIYTILMLFRAQANGSKNSVSHLGNAGKARIRVLRSRQFGAKGAHFVGGQLEGSGDGGAGQAGQIGNGNGLRRHVPFQRRPARRPGRCCRAAGATPCRRRSGWSDVIMIGPGEISTSGAGGRRTGRGRGDERLGGFDAEMRGGGLIVSGVRTDRVAKDRLAFLVGAIIGVPMVVHHPGIDRRRRPVDLHR